MKSILISAAVAGANSYKYISGEIRTKEAYTYGKFRTSMKTNNDMGTVASFHTFFEGDTGSPKDGQSNEIDVEIIPKEQIENQPSSPFRSNLIYGEGNKNLMEGKVQEMDLDWSVFHTYDIEWTPDYVSWKVDGKLVRKLTSKDSKGVRSMNKAQHLFMDFWNPTSAKIEESELPMYVKFDWVEYYSYNQKTKEFKFGWKDDFWSPFGLNLDRWFVGDSWGNAGSSCMWTKSQTYTKEGNLILKMDWSPKSKDSFHPMVIRNKHNLGS